MPSMNIKHKFFKNTFLTSTIIEWNKLDPAIRNRTSFNSFREASLNSSDQPQIVFSVPSPKGTKYLTRLQVHFSHLSDHKFKHLFQGTTNKFCTFSLEAEKTNNFIPNCSYYGTYVTFCLPAFLVSKTSFWIKLIIT